MNEFVLFNFIDDDDDDGICVYYNLTLFTWSGNENFQKGCELRWDSQLPMFSTKRFAVNVVKVITWFFQLVRPGLFSFFKHTGIWTHNLWIVSLLP